MKGTIDSLNVSVATALHCTKWEEQLINNIKPQFFKINAK